MTTRRRFMQTSSLAVAGLSHASIAAPSAIPGALPASEATPLRDYWNDLPNYLASVVNDARQRRKSELSKITTRAKAETRAAFVRSKFWELIGNPLEKTH